MGERWLSGLVFKEQRRLTYAERREFDALFKRLQTAKVAGIPALVASMVVAFVAISSSEAGALVGVLFLMGSVPLGLWWLEGAKFHGRLRKDLPEPMLDRYEYDPALPPMQQNTVPVRAVEVLSGSGAIWTEDGKRKSPLRIAYVSDTATVPERAGMVSEWMQTLDVNADEPTHRELSEEERKEIGGFVRALAMRVVWVGLLGFYGSAVLIRVLAERMIGQQQLYIGAVLLIGLVLSWFIRKDLRIALQLNIDAKRGWVVIFPSEQEDPKMGVVPGDVVEILPTTGMLWNVNAKPAAWRRG